MKENNKLLQKIKKIKDEYDIREQSLKDRAFTRAHSCIRTLKYNPTRKDLNVYATILLIPKRGL